MKRGTAFPAYVLSPQDGLKVNYAGPMWDYEAETVTRTLTREVDVVSETSIDTEGAWAVRFKEIN